MKFFLITASVFLFIGCYSHRGRCNHPFQQVSGLTQASVCWHPKAELLKDLDTLPDPTDRLIESQALPSGGRIKMIWRYTREGTLVGLAVGLDRQATHQPQPISLMLDDGARRIKCGQFAEGYEPDTESRESVIYCNMSSKPTSEMSVRVIDLKGFELAAFKFKEDL